LAFGASFISCWIRISFRNADPDPGDKSNADSCGSGSETQQTRMTIYLRRNRFQFHAIALLAVVAVGDLNAAWCLHRILLLLKLLTVHELEAGREAATLLLLQQLTASQPLC
jgi:hypothetical protein